ncbi:transcription factor kayak-like isoform X2 [Cylas formicarius]|uniref:transcription factor kayak-like isoform X2 n=1 Tax=Cylas formicarius TaxID=197179 RepID=UPI0029586D52|nr:transcription factor kayak-like isoform X2 [Cylas formicarius]
MNYFQVSTFIILLAMVVADHPRHRMTNKGKRGIADYSSSANLVPYHQQAQRPYGPPQEAGAHQPYPQNQYFQKPFEPSSKYYQVQQQQSVPSIPQKYIQATGYGAHQLPQNIGTPSAAGISQKVPSYVKAPYSQAGDVSSFTYSSPVASYNSAGGLTLFSGKPQALRQAYQQQPVNFHYQRPESLQYQQSQNDFQYQPIGKPLAVSRIVYNPQEQKALQEDNTNSISQQYEAHSPQQFYVAAAQQYPAAPSQYSSPEAHQYLGQFGTSQQYTPAVSDQQQYLHQQQPNEQESAAAPQFYQHVNSSKYKENQYQ